MFNLVSDPHFLNIFIQIIVHFVVQHQILHVCRLGFPLSEKRVSHEKIQDF